MALSRAKLVTDLKKIKELINNTGNDNTDAAIEKLADAIEAYVKSGQVVGSTSDGKTVSGSIQ